MVSNTYFDIKMLLHTHTTQKYGNNKKVIITPQCNTDTFDSFPKNNYF